MIETGGLHGDSHKGNKRADVFASIIELKEEQNSNITAFNKYIGVLNKNKFIVVEDSHIGLLCASNIGIDKIYLENKYSKKDYDLINRITEYKLNNFLDLYKIIKKI